MDVNAIIQLIANVGFPIACAVAMFYMLNKEREERIAENNKFVEAINNNTIIMQEVRDIVKALGK